MSQPHSPFATTQWTLIWRAADERSEDGKPALAEVVHRYWEPLYAFARRQGFSREDAEDATQEFLAEWMRGELLSKADPAKGRFRSYLLTIWKRFLIDRRRAAGQKRLGGGVPHLSIDSDTGEKHWHELSTMSADPDQVFLVSWAKSILAEAHRQVETSYRADGKGHVFDQLIPYLTAEVDAPTCQQLAKTLSMSTNAVRVALHRLRQRFGTNLHTIIASTVDDPEDVAAEVSDLLRALQHR